MVLLPDSLSPWGEGGWGWCSLFESLGIGARVSDVNDSSRGVVLLGLAKCIGHRRCVSHKSLLPDSQGVLLFIFEI